MTIEEVTNIPEIVDLVLDESITTDSRVKLHIKLDELCKLAIQALNQRWIPVSERLPEENGQYLITVKYKPEADYENIYAEHGEWADGRWDMFCFGHCGEVEGIVAWMPLPEPYKEVEGEDTE